MSEQEQSKESEVFDCYSRREARAEDGSVCPGNPRIIHLAMPGSNTANGEHGEPFLGKE